MYKVIYYATSTETMVLTKQFPTLAEAVEFSNKLPLNSVLEIKHYDDVSTKKPNRN